MVAGLVLAATPCWVQGSPMDLGAVGAEVSNGGQPHIYSNVQFLILVGLGR